MSILNLRAHYADGQVWIIWTPSPNAAPQANGLMNWDIFSSETDFTDVRDARHVARMFDQDCIPEMLMEQGNLANFKIPDGNGGTMTVSGDDRLFVKTVRSSGTNFYAVTDGNHFAVTVNAKVEEVFSLTEPPKPHPQGWEADTNEFNANYFYLWVDGDNNLQAGRPDFEIMANAYRTGCPHLFTVYAKNDHDFDLPAPMMVALHGGGGFPKVWRPSNWQMNSVNADPAAQFTLAHADRINVMRGGSGNRRVVWKELGWFGYRSEYNPFAYPNQDATNDEVIVNYSQKRILWINEWMIQRGSVNRNKISLCGYSAGSSGALRFSMTHPNVWSAVTLYCQGFRSDGGEDEDAFHGSRTQNLRTSLIGNHGRRIRWGEISNYTDEPQPMGEYPLVRVIDGTADTNDAMHWNNTHQIPPDVPVFTNYQEMDAMPFGFHLYWDGRDHGHASWNNHHWGRNTNQTQRDDFSYQQRYQNNLSFPGFFNQQTYSTQDPVPATGNDWGTWGGYFDWEVIEDSAAIWECDLWLIGNSVSPNIVDNSPTDELRSDLVIRRRQSFMTAPLETIYWQTKETGNGRVRTGEITTSTTGEIIFTNVRVFKDPNKTRLFLAKTPF